MVFSSVIFLFFFFPIFLALYFILPLLIPGKRITILRIKNFILFATSIIFYSWGEKLLVLVMLSSTVIDYFCGLMVSRQWGVKSDKIQALEKGGSRTGIQRLGLVLSIVTNLSILAFFKYFNFFIDNINASFAAAGFGDSLLGVMSIALPLGISFYSFQSMSYTIDVFRGDTKATRNFIDFACYVTMFPQLVAGPIVRYRDIAEQLVTRKVDTAGFAAGIRRFIIGLGKKVLIADIVSLPADKIFALPLDSVSFELAWLGTICYTLQIYFDFSGYSDMAIGIGQMLGFRYPENFNFPYISKSIKEFWRRWHISLSSWFRDYLYIPLGGSQKSKLSTYTNLVTVFFLCGLWHGASWTFVVWGLYHGAFLVIERLGFGNVLEKTPGIVRHIYVMITAMFGWVLFRAESFEQAIAFMRSMVGFGPATPQLYEIGLYATGPVVLAIVAGIIGSAPIARWLEDKLSQPNGEGQLPSGRLVTLSVLRQTIVLILLILAIAQMSAGTYSPFIYFRF